jgi:hypothetical protein
MITAMFSLSGILLIIGIIALILMIPTGVVIWASRTLWKQSGGKILQIYAVVLSSLVILFSLFCLGSATIWTGGSGEWARLALVPAFLLGLPAALFALVIAVIVRREVPANLRRVAIPLSIAALLSPFLVALLAR